MQDLSLLIQKSLDGSASDDELKELLKQLDQQEAHLKDKWMQAPVASQDEKDYPAFDQERIRLLINAKIKERPATAAKNKVFALRIWRNVAAAAVFIGLLLVMNYLFNNNTKPSVKQEQTITAAMQVIEAKDTNKDFTLPDGSQVLLFAGSTLRFSSDFNSSERNLYILGKGRFTVKQNKQLPFVVYSKHLATTALGTVFEVWERKDSTLVWLLNGKVSVRNYTASNAHMVYLQPGEQAINYKDNPLAVHTYSKQTESIAHRHSKEEKTTPATGLSFRQMPLEKVFKVLQKKYKATIGFEKDDVAGMIFTGSFGEQERLDAVLRVIAGINNLEIQTTEQGFIIRK